MYASSTRRAMRWPALVAEPAAYTSRIDGAEPGELRQVEAGQPELDRAGVVEPGVGAEVGGKPLGERRQPRDALRPVVERGRAGDQQVQAGEPAGVDLVDELAQRVQALVADVGRGPAAGSRSRRARAAGPGWPESRRTVSRPCRKPSAAKWSRSPLTPAARLAAAATFGWPPIQAISDCAVAWSPSRVALR